MFTIKYLFVLCYFILVSAENLAPFIKPCEWNDKPCLKASSQEAIPYLAVGLPDLGVPSFDPLPLKPMEIHQGELYVSGKDMTLKGLKKCKAVNVERNPKKSTLVFEVDCPIKVTGKYNATGKFLVMAIEGSGKFVVRTDSLQLKITVKLESYEVNGQNHWKITPKSHSFDPKKKWGFRFENLFNGDEAKVRAVETIVDHSWKDIIKIVGNPLFESVIEIITGDINKFFAAVPTDQLEK